MREERTHQDVPDNVKPRPKGEANCTSVTNELEIRRRISVKAAGTTGARLRRVKTVQGDPISEETRAKPFKSPGH